MTTQDSPLSQIEALIDDACVELRHACSSLELSVDDRNAQDANDETVDPIIRNGYDKRALRKPLILAAFAAGALKGLMERFREQTTYTAEDLLEFAEAFNVLLLETQYLCTLGAVRHAYEGYYRQTRKNSNRDAMFKSQERFAQIIRALAAAPARPIHKLSELYAVPEMPHEAVDYFLKGDSAGPDRHRRLRDYLKRAGLYEGKPGRPLKPRRGQAKTP